MFDGISRHIEPNIAHRAAIALIAVMLLVAAGCGKRGSPVPPKERVFQQVELGGFQRGNQVVLSWKMPARNAAKSSVINVSRADIYRLAEPANAPLALSEEEFANRSTLIAALDLTKDDFGLKTITYRDTLQFAGQAARLRYAIRLVNDQGQKAGFSNALVIEPTSKVAANPTLLSAVPTQESINLSWTAPSENVDGTKPASILGYNIYRSTSDKQPAKLLNTSPVTATQFRDEFFDFDQQYFYFVRAVSPGTLAEPTESSESNILRFLAKDTFAPTAPAAITVAASPNTISIFFAVNPESDIAGYNIYRTDDPLLDKAKWELLTPKPIQTNTFQDKRVESLKTYYYYLTAIDTRSNISPTSEVVSDTVP